MNTLRGRRSRLAPFAVAACLTVVTACATRPPQVLTPQVVPKAFVGQVAAPAAVWPRSDWWRGFDSPELSRLIDLAHADNRNLAVAAARLREARAQVTIQRATLFPAIEAEAQAVRSGVGRSALSSNGQQDSTRNSFGLNAQASYQLDVWGLSRDNLHSAQEALKSSRFAQQAVALTTTAAVANTYFGILALRERIAIANEDIVAIDGILQIVELKVHAGTASHLDLAQEQAQIQAVQGQLPLLEEQALEAQVALAVLIGRPPEGFAVQAQSAQTLRLPEVAPGLPSQLLLRRPDVAEAEANLAAAHANLQAARAAFLPQFALSGSAGFSSAATAALLHGPSFLWDAGAQLVQTIFDGGRLIGQKDLAYATQEELIASYQNAVLNAYADVESALGQVRNFAAQEQHLRQEVAAAREAFQISQLQYRQGVADLLNVLQAQQTLFGARDALAQARQARLQATVHLYAALGGGWQEPAGERTQLLAGK
ncbi:MAG TPA: efflux transporter outer membrane subunit [Steroidobacteraceae bacterium]|nr:efflux transporter outer membrane subunit [Steroidobacteraceae bacterium]